MIDEIIGARMADAAEFAAGIGRRRSKELARLLRAVSIALDAHDSG